MNTNENTKIKACKLYNNNQEAIYDLSVMHKWIEASGKEHEIDSVHYDIMNPGSKDSDLMIIKVGEGGESGTNHWTIEWKEVDKTHHRFEDRICNVFLIDSVKEYIQIHFYKDSVRILKPKSGHCNFDPK
jgi:hypothetical protein